MSILIVGCTRDDPGTGTGACIARTTRFRMALERAGVQVEVVSPSEGRRGAKELKELFGSRRWQAAVLISPFPAEAAVLASPELPLWIDLNGQHPAEVQLHGKVSNRGWEHTARMLALENQLLARGDRFSTPSRAQADAVLGELYLLGRSFGEDPSLVPVSALPHCVMPGWEERFRRRRPRAGLVASTGSFNLWFDHKTLFDALELAMEESPEVSFVSTGGAIPFSPGRYADFRRMVRESRHSQRFQLLGWVSRERLEEVYVSASVAVYADIPGGETVLGARTRALDWIGWGIPVACTSGAEISRDIASLGLGRAVPQGDPQALAEAILELSLSSKTSSAVALRQREWCSGAGGMDHIFAPLVQWCRQPNRLPAARAGRLTVPALDGPAYLGRIWRMVARDQGIGTATLRILRRFLPFLRRSRRD